MLLQFINQITHLKNCLQYHQLPTIKEKGSGRVLTSVEALKILEEKENVKAAEEKKKPEWQKKLLEKSSMLTLDTSIVVNVVEPVLKASCV